MENKEVGAAKATLKVCERVIETARHWRYKAWLESKEAICKAWKEEQEKCKAVSNAGDETGEITKLVQDE